MGANPELDMLFRLLLAAVLGGAVGFEREVHGRPAGFRTHLLVSLGAALFVLASIHFYDLFGNKSGIGPIGADPGRVASQVVAGIGFLGAGAIIREKASVRGLTTAACLWVVAAIGVACGVGLYFMAIAVTCMALLSLLLLKRVENLLNRDTYAVLKIWSDDREGQVAFLEERLRGCGTEVLDVSVERDKGAKSLFLEFAIRYRTRSAPCDLVDLVIRAEGVNRVRVG